MMNLIRIIRLTFLFLLLTAIQIYAATIDQTQSTPPTITITEIYGTTDAATLNAIGAGINAQIATAFTSLVDQGNAELAIYEDQEKIAKGFANASVYASRAATQQGYQDYSLFAITTGVMLGIQLPSMDSNYYTKTDQVQKEIEENGDLYVGVGTGLVYSNVGIHAGFINPYLWDLYFNFSYGEFTVNAKNISEDLEGSSAKSQLIAGGVSYSLINSKTIVPVLLTWRGLSFSTGFVYNKTDVNFQVEMLTLTQPVSYDFSISGTDYNVTGNLTLDHSFLTKLHTETYSIPLEINTSVKLISVLNLNLGIGGDYNFGSSQIQIKADGDITTDIADNPDMTATVQPGKIVITGKTKKTAPSMIDGRVMAGVGFNILPLKIDVPVTYYFDKGFAVGVTAGIIW